MTNGSCQRDEVMCPCCLHESSNSEDYELDESFSEIECEKCGDVFLAAAVFDVSYVTKKKEAKALKKPYTRTPPKTPGWR